jgi:hypothetical protein
MTQLVDGRYEKQLEAEMVRRATALLAPDGGAIPPGKIAHAIINTAARIGEEVTRRLDRVPEKQADNFYAAMGIGREAARPARVPVAFKLADTTPADLVALSSTRLSAETGETPVVFELESGIALAPGSIVGIYAVDLVNDQIFMPPPGVAAANLPRVEPILRALMSSAGAGASKLQIDPAEGLTAGKVLALGEAADATEHGILAVQGDLITIDLPLARTIHEGTPIREVTDFAPFAPGARNHQSHTLYLSHATMLDVPSALSIIVSGVEAPAETEWSWWGKTSDDGTADWQALEPAFAGGRINLKKEKGKPEKTDVAGRTGLWLRARLSGASTDSRRAQNIGLAVAGDDLCKEQHHQRCDKATSIKIAYDAIAVTTPVVPNKPYYPFGREPRIFDSFYIGCAEAFGKAGAEVSLCFTFGGPQLGPIAAISGGQGFQVFGVGTDGLLYQADFIAERPQLKPLPAPRDRDSGKSFPSQACVAARVDAGSVRVAVADKGGIYLASFKYGAPLTEDSVSWERLAGGPDDLDAEIGALFISRDAKASIYALAERPPDKDGNKAKPILLVWTKERDGFALTGRRSVLDLIPVDGGRLDAALIIEDANAGQRRSVKRTDDLTEIATLAPGDLPARERTAWAISPKDQTKDTVFYIAGFEDESSSEIESSSETLREIKLLRIRNARQQDVKHVGPCEALPIAFEPPPVNEAEWPPTLVIATEHPTRFVPQSPFAGESSQFTKILEASDIGASDNKHRRLLNWFDNAGATALVQHADMGLLYRRFDNVVIAGRKRHVILASSVPKEAQYLVFDSAAAGEGFLLSGDAEANRLLEPVPAGAEPHAEAKARFYSEAEGKSGELVMAGDIISLPGSDRDGEIVPRDDKDTVDIAVTTDEGADGSKPSGVWHITAKETSGRLEWVKPAGLPAARSLQYQLLDEIAAADKLTLVEYFQPSDDRLVQSWLDQAPLQATNAAVAVYELETFPGVKIFKFPHSLVNTAGGTVNART